MRTALYSRVSTADKGQDPTLQLHELRRYCEARRWTISKEIVDEGHSGSTDNRPGLKQLMTLARSRQVDAVVVLKLDRLFRSVKHLVLALEEFQALGVAFVAVREGIDYSTPSGRMFAQILGSLAEFERALIIERTKLGIEHARRKGVRMGRPKTRNDDEIRHLRSCGLSYSQIQLRLKTSKGAIYRALVNPPAISG